MINCETTFPHHATSVLGMWEFNGHIWAETYKLDGPFWKRYNRDDDTWEHLGPRGSHPTQHIPAAESVLWFNSI